MNDVTCTQVREAAGEFALGILPGEERGPMSAHLLRCPECRHEVDEMTRVGDQLLDLIPDAEPPLGFDRRVLSGVRTHRARPRKRWIGAGLGVLAAAAASVVGVVLADGHGSHPHGSTAALVADGHRIGSVYTEGRPPWVWMTVDHAAFSGRVTCDLLEPDGTVRPLGSFDLVAGSGSWAAPEPAGAGPIVGARLVSATGQVIATARFGS